MLKHVYVKRLILEYYLTMNNILVDKMYIRLEATYLSYVNRWNKVIIISSRESIKKDYINIIECLSVIRYVRTKLSLITDFGSGGDMLGVSIHLFRSDTNSLLIERSKKKSSLLANFNDSIIRSNTNVNAISSHLLTGIKIFILKSVYSGNNLFSLLARNRYISCIYRFHSKSHVEMRNHIENDYIKAFKYSVILGPHKRLLRYIVKAYTSI